MASKPAPQTPSAIDKLDTKKAKAVTAWREFRGNITNLCAAVGISRQTYYDWLHDDENFAKAISDVEAELNDEIRDTLLHLAADGNPGATIFYLKKRHPDFLDKPQTMIQVNGGKDMNVEFLNNE